VALICRNGDLVQVEYEAMCMLVAVLCGTMSEGCVRAKLHSGTSMLEAKSQCSCRTHINVFKVRQALQLLCSLLMIAMLGSGGAFVSSCVLLHASCSCKLRHHQHLAADVHCLLLWSVQHCAIQRISMHRIHVRLQFRPRWSSEATVYFYVNSRNRGTSNRSCIHH
jgi:hypothetical protein